MKVARTGMYADITIASAASVQVSIFILFILVSSLCDCVDVSDLFLLRALTYA